MLIGLLSGMLGAIIMLLVFITLAIAKTRNELAELREFVATEFDNIHNQPAYAEELGQWLNDLKHEKIVKDESKIEEPKPITNYFDLNNNSREYMLLFSKQDGKFLGIRATNHPDSSTEHYNIKWPNGEDVCLTS